MHVVFGKEIGQNVKLNLTHKLDPSKRTSCSGPRGIFSHAKANGGSAHGELSLSICRLINFICDGIFIQLDIQCHSRCWTTHFSGIFVFDHFKITTWSHHFSFHLICFLTNILHYSTRCKLSNALYNQVTTTTGLAKNATGKLKNVSLFI